MRSGDMLWLLVAVFGTVWFWWFLQGRAEVEDIPPAEQYEDTEAELAAFLARQGEYEPESPPERSEYVPEPTSDTPAPRIEEITVPQPREDRAVTTANVEHIEAPPLAELPDLKPLPPLRPLPPLEPFKPDS